MMKKTLNHIACFLLSLLLLIEASGPLPAFAAPKTDSFELNYSSLFPQKLLLNQRMLTLDGIPEGEDFSSLWLTLKDQSGKIVHNKIVSRDEQNSAFFPLDELTPGTYTIDLFHGVELEDYDFLLGDITFQLDANQAVFIKPEKAIALNQSAPDPLQDSSAAQAYFLRPSENIQSDDAQIIAQAKAITANLTDPYNKTLAIHNWVCDTVYYDYDAFRGRTSYGEQDAVSVLQSKLAVCAGYSNLTVALLRAAGIPARKVRGYALGISNTDGEFPQEVLNGGGDINHAWVEAYANGRWIIMDPTWDSGNDWEYGKAAKSEGCEKHRYFDIAPEFFSVNHVAIVKNRYQEMYLYLDNPQYRVGQEWKACGGHDAAPTAVQGTVMAPIGAILKELGGSYSWDTTSSPGWNHLTWEVGETHIQLWLGYKTFYVSGEKYQFDVAPRMVNGATLVQIRPLIEAMGHMILWEGKDADRHLTIRYMT